MPTREVYKVDQKTGARTYAGYAKFDNDGKFLGTRGGYPEGNNKNNSASKVQNYISTSGARQAARRKAAGL